MAEKMVIWDFDGTLAWREGKWRSALIAALDALEPGHGILMEDLRPHMKRGFPWHDPGRPHPELCEPGAWWEHVEGIIARAFEAQGLPPDRSRELAEVAHHVFIDPAGFQVYEDTVPCLKALADAGWRHMILSNHVPELESMVQALGLRSHFDAVLTSALIGYDKPHPETYRLALEAAGDPEQVWMVGDNPVADVQGAEALGIPAILVRMDGEVERRALDLWEAVPIILGQAR